MPLKTGLLWVSHAKDLEFFKVSARSYKIYASGWDFAKCVVPNTDKEAFARVCDENGIFLEGFDQEPGKGMLHHELMECYGDLHFPDAEVIFHIDADIVFATPTHVAEYLPDGKIFLAFTDFSNILSAPLLENEMMNFMGFSGRRADFNRGRYQWKFAADFALGLDVPRATMMAWPLAHHRDVYKKTREIIEKRFHTDMESYVFGCRNEFPQSFCEYETLGGVAYHFFQERYHWHNIHTDGHPYPRLVSAWSHGGFDRPHDFPVEYGGHQTPRELYGRLGLL